MSLLNPDVPDKFKSVKGAPGRPNLVGSVRNPDYDAYIKAQKATKAAADEDDAIEANTGGFTADDIKEALESRTPGMQALLRARPDES